MEIQIRAGDLSVLDSRGLVAICELQIQGLNSPPLKSSQELAYAILTLALLHREPLQPNPMWEPHPEPSLLLPRGSTPTVPQSSSCKASLSLTDNVLLELLKHKKFGARMGPASMEVLEGDFFQGLKEELAKAVTEPYS